MFQAWKKSGITGINLRHASYGKPPSSVIVFLHVFIFFDATDVKKMQGHGVSDVSGDEAGTENLASATMFLNLFLSAFVSY